GVVTMQEIDVDVVGLEAAQADFDLLQDVMSRAAARIGHAGPGAGRATTRDVNADLRRDDHVLALRRLANDLADELLRLAVGLDVGGTDEIDAFRDTLLEDGLRCLEVAAPADIVRANTEDRNVEACAAELAELHRDSSFGVSAEIRQRQVGLSRSMLG